MLDPPERRFPAVLRMIDRTVQATKSAGIWVGVCGGMAADPQGAVLLTGLGVSELSVSIPSVAAVKAQLRKLALSDAKSLTQKALACRNAMLSGVVAGKIENRSLKECARLATASSVMAVTYIGAGLPSATSLDSIECQVQLDEIKR